MYLNSDFRLIVCFNFDTPSLTYNIIGMHKESNEFPQRVATYPFKSPILQINKDRESQSDQKATQNDNSMNTVQNPIPNKFHQRNPRQKQYLYNHHQQNEDIEHVGRIMNKWKDIECSPKDIVTSKANKYSINSQLVYHDEIEKDQEDKHINRQIQHNQNTCQGKQLCQKAQDNHRYQNKNSSDIQKHESIDSSLTDSFQISVLSHKSKSFQNSRISLKNSEKQPINIQPRKKDKKRCHNIQAQNFNKQKNINKPRISKKQSHDSGINQIIDTRKKPEKSLQHKIESRIINQKFNCFRQLSLQRTLTFVLIYQIIISFLGLTSYIFGHYWILSYQVAIVLVLPTFFGVKCVSLHKIKSNKLKNSLSKSKSMGKSGKKISNSFYANRLQQSKSNDNFSMGSIGMLQQYKIHPISKIEPQLNDYNSIQNSSTEQNSKLSFLEFQSTPFSHSKYLLVVPYLHNNQLHHFTKCAECSTSHSNSRIKHCQNCQACHYGYDHYCKWLATCIDATNYSYFLKFVTTLWILSVLLLGSGGYVLYQSSTYLGSNFLQIAFLCFIILEVIFGFMFCTYILGYHVWLNFRGVSTRQHFAGIKQNSNNSIFCKNIRHDISDQYFNNFLQQIPLNCNEAGIKIDIQEMQSLTSSKFFDNVIEHLQNEENNQNQTEIPKLYSSKLMKIHNIKQQQQYSQNQNDLQTSKQKIQKQQPLSGSFKIYDSSISQAMEQDEKKQSTIANYNKDTRDQMKKIILIKNQPKQKQWINALQADQVATQMDSPIKLSSRRKQNEKD